ncbi:MAG TPA: hypothetical protein VF889_03090 [Bacteroidota bacterium]
MARTHSLWLTVLSAAGSLLFLLAWALWLYFRDYSPYFREHHGTLASVEAEHAGGDSLTDESWLTLRNGGGFTVECGLLTPRSEGGRRFPFDKLRQPKKIVWIESRHVNPRNPALTRQIIAAMRRELERLGMLGRQM